VNRVIVTFVSLVFGSSVWAQHSFPFDSDDWRIEGEATLETDATNNSVLSVGSGKATLDDADFQDGTIEFETYVSGDRAFVYLMFRGQNDAEYEDVYFRPHKSGLPDSVQYAPVFQGRSAWQLYHGDGGTAPGRFPVNEWIKIKVQADGNTASVWVGENSEPNLVIDQLGHHTNSGWLAVRGFIPRNSSAEYAAKFRNFRVTRGEPAETNDKTMSIADGQLVSWRVSPAFDAPLGPIVVIPENIENATWDTPPIQANGVFEFLRSRPIPEGSRHWAVAADVTLQADAAINCTMHLGYSDELTLLHNGMPIAYQDSSYRFDAPRQDGVLHDKQLTVFLDLVRGDNRVRVVVADRFGGWGLRAKLETCSGVHAR